MRAKLVVAALALTLAALALAQAPPPPTPPPSAEAEDQNLLVEGETLYRHMADRDPFSPLVKAAGKGGEVKVDRGMVGIQRFTVEQCTLEGVIKTPNGVIALFQGPDAKPYQVKVGDKFADGRVTKISYEKGQIVVQQQLIDDKTEVKPFRDLELSVRSQGGEGK